MKTQELVNYILRTGQKGYKDMDDGLRISDEMTRLVEEQINQEVEKRIAERMPSEEEIRDELCRHLYNWLEHNSFKDACRWLRSRLTCSEKPNNSQKSEGGEG